MPNCVLYKGKEKKVLDEATTQAILTTVGRFAVRFSMLLLHAMMVEITRTFRL